MKAHCSMPKPPRIAIIHIPKTGGMWLRFALQAYFEDDDFCPLQDEANFPDDLHELAHFNLFDAHLGYDFASKLNANLITVLRNPYDRIISIYHYLREVPYFEGPPLLAKSMSFDRFIASVDEDYIATALVNAQTWQLTYGLSMEARDQHRGISADELLAQAKENLRHLAAVGVQEDMPTLAAAIASSLGLQIDLTQPRANTTKSRPDASQISMETREKIHPIVSIDLALYEHVLAEYVFSARSQALTAALIQSQTETVQTETVHAATAESEKEQELVAPQGLVPTSIRKAISINGIRKLVRV